MNDFDRKKILEEKILKFNPSDSGYLFDGIFGLPFELEESKIVLVPVPWEATVSYGGGTALGPKTILDSSHQVDLFDPINPEGWKEGIYMSKISLDILKKSKKNSKKTEKYLKKYNNRNIDKKLQNEINSDCFKLNNHIKEITKNLLNQEKIVGIIGGDHSSPLGYLEALSEKYTDFGILHIDAHSDLRNAYLGLEYSHASIFFNALKIKNISKLVQVGIRDFSEEEYNFISKNKDRISFFTDYEIRKTLFEGKTLKEKYSEIIKCLPNNIYISFDIDGLIPYLNPNTGTPVAGGFTLEEIVFLFEEIINSGKKIIGFDLCEVAPNEWDGNVGSRVLYKLCLLALKSNS
jgi:agmatinase